MARRGDRPEALVIGGGPAGLVFALAAVRRGLAVRLIDQRRPPMDKPCGEGLMPDGLEILMDLGVDPPGRPFQGIRYVDGGTVATGTFPDGPGRGVRRTELHRSLVAAAEEAGVDCRWGVAAQGLAEALKQMPVTSHSPSPACSGGLSVLTSKGPLEAPLVVAADGLRSQVRAWAGLHCEASTRPRRFGVRRHFRVEPWGDRVEVHWADGCEAYVTPVSAQEVGVAILWDANQRSGAGGFDTLLGAFPGLAARLQEAEPTSSSQGCGPLAQCPRGYVSLRPGPVVLLGDAAGYLDAITGEGLSLAFQEAVILAHLLAEKQSGKPLESVLRRYERRVARLRRLPETWIRLLLFAEVRPWLRRRLVAALARDEGLFSRLLAVHARQRPLGYVGLRGAVRLARGLL